MAKIEGDFQARVIKRLKLEFPGCVILKNDARYLQGVPDLIVLYLDHWAMLECKREWSAKKRPNQDYWVDILDQMSFARFLCPENEEEVFYDLQRSFKS